MFRRLILSHALRRRVSWIIAAVLILPFIIFFHATGQSPKGPGGAAGTVFGKSISWDEFATQRQWLARQFAEQVRQAPALIEELLTRYTWERIMLLEEAKRRRLRVDDAELVALLERQEVFQEGGRFLPERYRRYVRAIGMSPQAFEALLREDVLIGKLLDGVKATAVVTDADVKVAYTAAHERLKATVILFHASAFSQQAASTITEEDLQASYTAHPEHVRIPEQMVIEYLGTSKEELVSRLSLREEELNAYYQDHPEEFSTEQGEAKPFAEVREMVRQRLMEERVRKQFTTLALDLREDLESKLRFEEIASTRALTPKTAGPIARDAFWAAGLPDFAIVQAVKDLPEGRFSDVIQTERGVYLARVVQQTPSRVPPLEEVKEQVKTRLTEERARSAAQDAAKAWLTRIRERQAAGWRFEEAAVVGGATSARPATFTRTEAIGELGSVPAANQAAFAVPLGSLTEIIDTPSGFVVVRPEERIPADEAGFAQEQETLREETIKKKQSETLDTWMQQLRDRAKLRSFLENPATSPPTPLAAPRP